MADNEKSIIRDGDLSIDDDNDVIPETSTKEDKSLKDELKSNIGKIVVRALSGEGLYFNRIKIDENLLKKIF